ncbi:MAG: hypothetical protein ABJA20_13685, partial [Novosphingobium sp.]
MFAHLAQLKKRYSWIWRSGLPFVTARYPTALERLRVFGLKAELRGRRPVTRVVGWWLLLLCWPVASLSYAITASRKDRAEAGASAWGKFCSYYGAALTHNARPGELQWLGMQAGVAPDMAPQLLFNRDSRIWQALNRLNGADGDDVQDKARFFQLCERANLRAVPVYAAFARGESLLPIDRKAASGRSLFVKSLRGQQGEGAAIWRWATHSAGEGYSDGTTIHPTLDELLTDLARTDCVVQPLLSDHALLRAAGSEGLSSLRIVTARIPDGQVRAVCALLLMSKGMLSQFGESFGIDIRDGSLTTWLDTRA